LGHTPIHTTLRQHGDEPARTDDQGGGAEEGELLQRIQKFYTKQLRAFAHKTLAEEKLRKEDLLNDDNWLLWKTRLLGGLRAVKLVDYVLGTLTPPDKKVDLTEYDAWNMLDQVVTQFIKKNLCQTFEPYSWQIITTALQSLCSKKADEDDDLIAHPKDLCMQLANLNYVMDDHLFNGM
jgi:hypothetical protein